MGEWGAISVVVFISPLSLLLRLHFFSFLDLKKLRVVLFVEDLDWKCSYDSITFLYLEMFFVMIWIEFLLYKDILYLYSQKGWPSAAIFARSGNMSDRRNGIGPRGS